MGVTHNTKAGRAMKFFKSISWDKWWMEFSTAREPNGRLKYLSAWTFAKSKGKDNYHQDLIYQCIGPKPVTIQVGKNIIKPKKNRMPYLGDWQIERAKAYFYDNKSVESMKKVVTERLDGLEAGRGAATVILDLIAKWTKYDDRLDEVFNYSPVFEGLKDGQNERMADRFFKLKNKTRYAIQNLVEQYLKCHGIESDGVNDLGQLVLAASQSAARAALAGTATGAAIQQQSPALNMLAQAIMDKSQTFKLPLPSAIMVEANGKEHNDE